MVQPVTHPSLAARRAADGRRRSRANELKPGRAATGALAGPGGLAAHTPVRVDGSSIRHRPLAPRPFRVADHPGCTGLPFQLISVQPSRGLPWMTTMPVLGSGSKSSSNGSGFLTVIIVPTPMANSLENATPVIRPLAARTGFVTAPAYTA